MENNPQKETKNMSQTYPLQTLNMKLPYQSGHNFHMFRESLERPPHSPPPHTHTQTYLHVGGIGHQNIENQPQEGLPKSLKKERHKISRLSQNDLTNDGFVHAAGLFFSLLAALGGPAGSKCLPNGLPRSILEHDLLILYLF